MCNTFNGLKIEIQTLFKLYRKFKHCSNFIQRKKIKTWTHNLSQHKVDLPKERAPVKHQPWNSTCSPNSWCLPFAVCLPMWPDHGQTNKQTDKNSKETYIHIDGQNLWVRWMLLNGLVYPGLWVPYSQSLNKILIVNRVWTKYEFEILGRTKFEHIMN